MADRFWARIEIGGRVKDSDLARLCQCAPFKWDATPEDIRKHLQDGRLVLDDPEACYGRFEELESLCEELGLSYRRQSDGKYEFTPEIVAWRPGLEEPECVLTDHTGEPVVSLKTVRDIRDALKAGRHPEALSLAEAATVEPSRPPPLEIVDN